MSGWKRAVIAPVLTLVLACDTGSTTTADDSCLSEVVVAPALVQVTVGDSLRVTARADACVDYAVERYTWTVANQSMATVFLRSDSTAIVIGNAPGASTITVKSVDNKLSLVSPLVVLAR